MKRRASSGTTRGALRLLSDGELVLRACTDSARALMSRPRMKVGEGLTGLVVASGEAFAVEDLAEYERYDPELRSAAVRHGLRAGLAVPLRALGQIVGALVLFCKDRRRFMDDEIGLLTAFADQSALAIVKDRLLRQAEDRARRLRTLARLNQVVSSSLDLNEVLAAIARAAAEIMQARHASFWVVDPSGQRLTVGAVSDETWWSDYPSPAMTLARGGVTAAVARDQQEIGIPDVCGDPRIMAPEWYRAHGLTSYYGIPIVLDGSTVAVLNLAGSAPFSFDADGRDVLDSFVAQAAAALRNARLYEERRLANEQLIQSERLRALGEMAAGVAHHFNNLLAIVSGRTQLLLRRTEDGELRRALSIIEQAVSDGAQRVRRIQEFTRTRPASPGGHVELSRLLQEVADLTSSRWKDEAQSRGIHYSVRVEGDAVAVAGAPDELREVFINLLMNALEAMPSGGECTLRVHVEDDCAVVGVRDTGSGMSEETRTRAFEPFFSTKGPRGNGLGLAVVWGIVTRYGGTVQIESAPGLGCTFTIRLPLSREAARSTDPPPPPSAVRPARILVVDDEHEVGTILADLLSTIGYSAVHVSTGREGLALCESERFDAILSDLSMPEMSGWQVAAACRERYPGVPVGLVTGWGNQLDPGQLAEHRIRFVLPKPFNVAEVARQVGEALREGTTAGSTGS
jgi:signal transduction histidine kinase/ActR/RegA family two-component response regulator